MAGLAFELGADTKKFDKAMDHAKNIVLRRTGEMVSAVSDASAHIDKAFAVTAASGALGSHLKTATGLFIQYKSAILIASAATAAWGTVAALAANQVEKLQEVSAGMKSADVSAGFFQIWAKTAEEAGHSTQEATRALVAAREAVRRTVDGSGQTIANPITDLLGEVALGKGIATGSYADFISSADTEKKVKAVAEAIRALNAEVLKGGDSRLNLIGDKLGEMAFGNAKFAETIRQSKDSLDGLLSAATAAGTIFSNDLVKRSKELDDALKEAHRTMADGLKPITNDLAQLGLSIKEGWVDVARFVSEAAKAAGFLYSQVKKIDDLVPRLNLGQRVAQALTDAGFAGTQQSRTNDIFRAALKHPGVFGKPGDAEALARAAKLDPRLVDFTPTIPGDGREGPIPPRRPPPSELNAKATRVSASAPTTEDVDLVERYLNQLRRSVEILEAEASTLGKSKAERALAIEMARAEAAARERGTALTEKEIAQTTALAAKKAQLNKVLDDFQQRQQQMNELGGFVGNQLVDAFDSILTKGGSVNEVLDSIRASLVKVALQAVLMGQGPLAGLFGTASSGGGPGGLIGSLMSSLPGRATGGPVSAGSAYMVGERGREIFVPQMPGHIIPNHRIARGLEDGGPSGGGGGGMNVVIENHGADVQTRQETGPSGAPQLKVIVRQVMMEDVAKNGPFAQLMQNTYGNKRTSGR